MGKSLGLLEQIKAKLSQPKTRQQAGRVLSKWLGQQKEKQALDYLQKNGVISIAQNFRCDQYQKGEIDLIGLDTSKQILIFFEVKYRKNSLYGHPTETLSAAQQQRIRRCAQVFLQKQPQYQNHDCRFDVISFIGDKPPEWIKNAF
ncbi:UPF0102 protein [Thiosulfatimonas sediminis]|uniref:UPF0102 protein THMIRHAS_19430 n=1 Tax=Thiosulfatimonas sediminis TaxID=2675054 RepID=A0A6F8PX76_9GAMM|nr:YraN family protein [Thiosulfatimonas sediminis]BBP46570.1 UPF0102 protein [Thiosulfatimonas sediminis]